METDVRNLAIVALIILLIVIGKNRSDDKREIRLLKNEVRALKEERPDLWTNSCRNAVYSNCIRYADCAVTPIEIIQEKLCQAPEEL